MKPSTYFLIVGFHNWGMLNAEVQHYLRMGDEDIRQVFRDHLANTLRTNKKRNGILLRNTIKREYSKIATSIKIG